MVFDSDELGITLVKRLVGLPGDHVVLDENGRMTLNGEPVEEPYVFHKDSRTADFTVPEGHYLFLGDNRSGSNDARMWSQPEPSTAPDRAATPALPCGRWKTSACSAKSAA